VLGARYSESEVETDAAALELEMNMATSGQVVSHEILNQEWYSAN
jgi:hypothetical protein